ncbi:hypothetical protein VP01_8110g1, partial [Puccinia sorghi]
FFDKNQFLLADSDYTSDWFTLPAYKGKKLLDHQNVKFNYHLSHLHELWTQIRNFKGMKDIIKWIISCIILHNLLADLKDQWNELYVEDEHYSAPNLHESCHIISNLSWPPLNHFFNTSSLLSSAPNLPKPSLKPYSISLLPSSLPEATTHLGYPQLAAAHRRRQTAQPLLLCHPRYPSHSLNPSSPTQRAHRACHHPQRLPLLLQPP